MLIMIKHKRTSHSIFEADALCSIGVAMSNFYYPDHGSPAQEPYDQYGQPQSFDSYTYGMDQPGSAAPYAGSTAPYTNMNPQQIAYNPNFSNENGSYVPANMPPHYQMQPMPGYGYYPEQKSKIGAALLAFFLGALGIHNFYLGYIGRGIAQLLITVFGVFILVGPLISGIWAFVEFILILVGSLNDARGVPLKD